MAEIAKINSKNGHHYLELVDSHQGRTTALMSASIWSSAYKLMLDKVGVDLANILQSGNKVLFQMRIEYHKVYGLKLNVLNIDPSFSFGEIERKKQECIQQLKDEGLYGLQKELYLPIFAKRIAIIGSPGTSGYRDFLNELQENQIFRNFQIKEFAATVQGDKAVQELINAVVDARQYNVDVIVIVRGGGSKMDLNVFNQYDFVKEICLTQIPVLTGVGHESDEVVADLICKQMCITPTAAAKYLYEQIGVFSSQLRMSFDGVLNKSLGMLGGAKDEFHHLNKYLVHYSQQMVLEAQVNLRQESHQLQLGFLDLIAGEKSSLQLALGNIASQAVNKLHLMRDADLPARIERIQLMSSNYLQQKKIGLDGLNELLNMLDPIRLIENGYTISTIEDQDVYQLSADLIGKEMKTLTTHAIISSTITATEKKKL